MRLRLAMVVVDDADPRTEAQWCRCSHFPMRSVQPAHAHHPNFDLCMWFTAHGAMTMVFYISQVAQCVRMGRHRGMTLCTYTGTGSMHG